MDTQLQELIDRIKDEGVKNAQKKADEIILDAKRKANDIVADAHEEASKIIADAKRESAKIENAGQESLKQAGRDLILGLRARIIKMFDSVIEQQASDALSGEGLNKAVVTLLSAWAEGKPTELDVLLPSNEFEKLELGLRSRLAEVLAKGVEIKPVEDIKAGFRVAMKDGSAYYNFTAEGIAEVLSASLTPRLTQILKDAAAEKTKE